MSDFNRWKPGNRSGPASARPLAEFYAAMPERELRELAETAATLTDAARAAVQAEVSRRGLDLQMQESVVPAEKLELRKLVKLRQFGELHEALLARTILESAGVECFLGDDNLIRMDWFWSNLLGGVKLLVRREDADSAERLLAEGIPSTAKQAATNVSSQSYCPDCQSEGIPFNELSKPVNLSDRPAEYINLNTPLSRRRWKCPSCGSEWTQSDNAV